MNSTVREFKDQQTKELQILNKLQDFIKTGDSLGVEIDSSIKDKLSRAIDEVEVGKLKVALIGGFSEGKTSIAAAWLEKLDPSTMKITHEESSNEVVIYDVGDDIELVDTPGLFGYKEKEAEKYKDITRKYVSEAHLVLYVVNSENPIKESHQHELNWLFRELNLLPRTVFVLSQFDKIADVEDETAYQHHFNTKKNNIINGLKSLIKLSSSEESALSIVAVSANPFGQGIDYWLNNIDKFKRLSHIGLLQKATEDKIKQNGGSSALAIEAKKSIIQDVLSKQLPIAQECNAQIESGVKELREFIKDTDKNLFSLQDEINYAKKSLSKFIVDYFSDLTIRVKGTSLQTINEFVDREIGNEGINITTRIQNEFIEQTRSANIKLNKISTNFIDEVEGFDKMIRTYGKQGINFVTKSGVINSGNIIALRNGIEAAAKMIGINLGSLLKFKPWGAIKLANGVGAGLSVLGLAFELWDAYNEYKNEEKFKEAISKMVDNFDNQKKELLELIDSQDFINEFFPTYMELQQGRQELENKIVSMNNQSGLFDKWVDEGKVIDAEFEEIKRLN